MPIVQRGDKTWWWFDGDFYWENEGLQGDEVEALILERRAKLRKGLSGHRSSMRIDLTRPGPILIPHNHLREGAESRYRMT